MSDLDAQFAEAQGLQNAGHPEVALELFLAITQSILTANLACRICDCLLALGRLDEARTWLDKAVGHKPDSPVVLESGLRLAFAFLAVGRYREGWPMLEVRQKFSPGLVPPVQVNFPEWKGEPLAGRSILISVEQGFGDQIMFARFARTLAERGATVALGCKPRLASLFAPMPFIDELIPIGLQEKIAIKHYDYWSRYFSLPEHLGITLENLPGAPYLSAPADRRERWGGYSGIGLMWRVSPTGQNAAAKRLPEDQARRLLDLGLVDLDPEQTGVTDFADTAAIIEQLDLVVSVDTSVAHLAGAMGKPCWTLLPAKGLDWRWMKDRADSPWYPSMRLFRQQPGEDWTRVIDAVIAELPRA